MKVTTPSEPTSDSEHEEETIEVEDDTDDSEYYYSDSDIEEEKESSEPKTRYCDPIPCKLNTSIVLIMSVLKRVPKMAGFLGH